MASLRSLLVFDASPSSFSPINSLWAGHLQAHPGIAYAILGRPVVGLSWLAHLQDRAAKGSVVLCLGGEPDYQLVDATVALGIHLVSDTRSPIFLKSLLYHFDYAAFKTSALVIPTFDLLGLTVDITTSLLNPSPSTISITTTFNSPPVRLLTAAQESLAVQQHWNHQGVPFPPHHGAKGSRVHVLWDREDRLATAGSTLTEPYHAIVNRISQHRSKIFYQYQEQDANGHFVSWLSTVCALWVTLWSYVSTPSWDVVGQAPVSLPLDLSVRKEEKGGRSRTMRVVVPPPKEGSKITPHIVALTELALILLENKTVTNEGGVVSASVALGSAGSQALRKRLEERAGWTWTEVP